MTVGIKKEADGSYTLRFIRCGEIYAVVRDLCDTEMMLLHQAVNDSAGTL